MDSRTEHYPVLLHESIANLNIHSNGIYVDGTFGMGGHSAEILSRLEKGKLIAFDKDPFAIEKGKQRFSGAEDRILFVNEDFRNLCDILDRMGIEKVDGMLFDLGVSSPQLDNAYRGFSYMKDAPLDMRMDTRSELTASEIVNCWDAERLSDLFWKYGEERYSRRIADAIVRTREKKKIETTVELSEIIRSAMPAAALREKQHPAKRTFQAIRIAVNDELGAVSEMIRYAPDKLADHGRLCVITFHSLEDRIVKQGIAARENGCICPRELPVCVCGFRQTLRSVSRKPILPTETERLENPRSRSAKLRVAEKTGEM